MKQQFLDDKLVLHEFVFDLLLNVGDGVYALLATVERLNRMTQQYDSVVKGGSAHRISCIHVGSVLDQELHIFVHAVYHCEV